MYRRRLFMKSSFRLTDVAEIPNTVQNLLKLLYHRLNQCQITQRLSNAADLKIGNCGEAWSKDLLSGPRTAKYVVTLDQNSESGGIESYEL